MKTSRKKGGFTLIELLVVIAIIAILAAILFPVFAKAREMARKSTCSSNMKECALAYTMYVSDNQDTNPTSRASGATPTAFRINVGALPPGAGVALTTWPMALYTYKRNGQLVYCPSDGTGGPGTGRSSYYLKAAVDSCWKPGVTRAPWKESDFNWPAEQVMLFERGSFHWGGKTVFVNDNVTTGTPPAADASAGNVDKTGAPLSLNMAFMDGHVKTMRIPASSGTVNGLDNIYEPNFYSNVGGDPPPTPVSPPDDPRYYMDGSLQ